MALQFDPAARPDPDLEKHPGLAGMVATLLTAERADFLEKA